MLTGVEKTLFILLAIASLYYGGKGFYDVYRTVTRCKPDPRFDNLPRRIRRAVWIVLTQQSVFKARPIVSVLHAMVFYGFVFYVLVNLVDGLEGFFSFQRRGGLWNAFNLLADLLTAGVLIGMIGLIIRRFFARPRDFAFPSNVPVKPEVRPEIIRASKRIASRMLAGSLAERAITSSFGFRVPNSKFQILTRNARLETRNYKGP